MSKPVVTLHVLDGDAYRMEVTTPGTYQDSRGHEQPCKNVRAFNWPANDPRWLAEPVERQVDHDDGRVSDELVTERLDEQTIAQLQRDEVRAILAAEATAEPAVDVAPEPLPGEGTAL